VHLVLWLTGLVGSALCLVAHARSGHRSWVPGVVPAAAMALMVPGAPAEQAVLAAVGCLAALVATFVTRRAPVRGVRVDLAMTAVLSAAMSASGGHVGHGGHAGGWGQSALAVFFAACWLVLRAGAMLVGRAWRAPGASAPPIPRESTRDRIVGETGRAVMMLAMAWMMP
jgi:hypothetical protein